MIYSFSYLILIIFGEWEAFKYLHLPYIQALHQHRALLDCCLIEQLLNLATCFSSA